MTDLAPSDPSNPSNPSDFFTLVHGRCDSRGQKSRRG